RREDDVLAVGGEIVIQYAFDDRLFGFRVKIVEREFTRPGKIEHAIGCRGQTTVVGVRAGNSADAISEAIKINFDCDGLCGLTLCGIVRQLRQSWAYAYNVGRLFRRR